jgi:type IV pilus assembly protein PilN
MIKINLLTTERKAAKKAKVPFQLAGQKVTVLCSSVLVVAALGVAWRYWSLQKESARINEEIASAQQETARLQSIIGQVRQFEQRKTQLQQRVALIEQLRRDQTGPVHMLDQISRSLPPMLWLTNMRQGQTAADVILDGRCTTMTGLSDFVSNLEATGYFKRGIEIIQTVTEPTSVANGELIRFSIRAIFQTPGAPAAPTPAVATAAAR